LYSGAGTIFGQGGWGQNRKRQIDGTFIEFGPLFCPRNKRSLKKKVFAEVGPLFCPRNKCSLKKRKKRSLPTSDCVCLARNQVAQGGQNISRGQLLPYRFCSNTIATIQLQTTNIKLSTWKGS